MKNSNSNNKSEMENLTQVLEDKIKEITEEKNRFETIFHGVSEGIFTIDNNWVIRSFNRSAEKITGYSRNEAKGKKCWSIFNSPVCRNGCHMENTLKEKCLMANKELYIKHKNGQQIPIRVSSEPLFNSGEECIGGIETFRDISEIKNLHEHLKERYLFENIIGSSKPMRQMYDLLYSVAQSDSTVLITGASGTGKELVARAIHLNSERHLKPFVAVNCSAFAETLLESELFGHEKGAFTGAFQTKPGRFELAQEGTLFLDEIGDISPTIQVKLLRVIETLQFERVGGTKSIKLNLRIIVATNKDLLHEIHERRFREDLFYRINVVNIQLPPLKDRLDDIPLLIDHFINKFKVKFNTNIKNISSEGLDILMSYGWPGNIRELENVIEHAFVLCKEENITPACLPKWLVKQYEEDDKYNKVQPRKDSIKDAEKHHLESILEKYDGHRSKTAQALGIDKSTLWRKMKKFDLQ